MSSDTTPEAAAVHAAVLRRMSAGQRVEMAAELSLGVRATALASIRARHPRYSDHEAQLALFRLLVGDELFRKAWPDAPLLAA